jgi:hypothetical protein
MTRSPTTRVLTLAVALTSAGCGTAQSIDTSTPVIDDAQEVRLRSLKAGHAR